MSNNSFIGLTMLVTLNSPPGAQLRGMVSSIEPGKSLTLRNVTCPANGKYVPEFTINAAEIVELVEAANENVPPPVAAKKKKSFEDPAILSMGKRPAPAITPSSISDPTAWEDASWQGRGLVQTPTSQGELPVRDPEPSAALIESIKEVTINYVKPNGVAETGDLVEELEAEVSQEQQFSKAGRRTRRRKAQARSKVFEDTVQDPDTTPAKKTTKSKGWRETPLLEPNPSFQPFSTLRRKKTRGTRKSTENGWATEDATDVQDMGDFDFAGSLAKFDKHTIFNQIQAKDEVADEDRLVAHNRLPKAKPGTASGKNLHYTENVLDINTGAARSKEEIWKSEAGDSELEERNSPRDTGSGRSRKAESKLGANSRANSRRPISRKESSVTSSQPTRTSTLNVSLSKPGFFLVPSDRRCEPVSALQMLNLENIADNELGLSEDMMTENAGRGIAEVALSALNSGGRGPTQGKGSTIPTVVVYAGNNKSGLRAVAAGRHLRNHGVGVIICVLGLEREPELLVGLRRQLKVFRNFGGRVVTKFELLEVVKALPIPIDLIIDGLLGLTISFEELRTGDQATAYELIEWANRSKASVLAIDVPTGIDPATGKVGIIDGRKLYIHSTYVVAMGAPKKGLLEAMVLGEGVADDDGVGKGREWQLFVADIGLGIAVWKKAGTRVRRGVDFEGSWVVRMRFQSAVE